MKSPADSELQRIVALARRPRRAAGDVRRRGVSALFAGPSRRTKALAAQDVASRLGLGVHRIDLSLVISKYIGETEKNLSRLFDEAESGDWVLFFDEADALFGKRTEVRDAHDRYANIEANFLLQRIESYPGVVIVACNRKENLDATILRRFAFVVTIPPRSRPARRPPRS